MGVVLPFSIWAVFQVCRLPGEYLVKFFAGFCLIANGAYIAFGSFERIGDAGQMIKLGSSIWMLWLFGMSTMPIGLLLWHRLGPHFGLGEAKGQVDKLAAYASLVLFSILFVSTCLLSPR